MLQVFFSNTAHDGMDHGFNEHFNTLNRIHLHSYMHTQSVYQYLKKLKYTA